MFSVLRTGILLLAPLVTLVPHCNTLCKMSMAVEGKCWIRMYHHFPDLQPNIRVVLPFVRTPSPMLSLCSVASVVFHQELFPPPPPPQGTHDNVCSSFGLLQAAGGERVRCWLPQWGEAKGGSQTSRLPASTTKDYQVQEGNSAEGGRLCPTPRIFIFSSSQGWTAPRKR